MIYLDSTYWNVLNLILFWRGETSPLGVEFVPTENYCCFWAKEIKASYSPKGTVLLNQFAQKKISAVFELKK